MTPPSLRHAPAGSKAQPARPYSAVPHDLLRDRRLLPIDVLTAAALLVYARAGATCWPSIRTLMADVGRTRRTVQMSLARLREAGWVASEPAPNPTGRVLVLAWRRGAQRPAPPGRNPSAGAPASPVAPEWKKQGEEPFAPPPGGRIRRPPEPLTPDQVRALHTESGWLARPIGDPLRRLAERRLSEAPRGPRGPAGPPPPPGRPAGGRGGGGPRPLFGG